MEQEEEEEKLVKWDQQFEQIDKIIIKCAQQLDNLWAKIETIINNEPEVSGDDKNKATELTEEMTKVTTFLIAASKNEHLVNVACVFCQRNKPFYKIYNWTGKHRTCLKQMATEQLRYFQAIVANASTGLLTSKHVMVPLYLLLLSLQPKEKRKVPLEIELLFINILYHLSQKIEDITVLAMLSKDLFTEDGFKINKYTFFELLILYTHNAGEAGNIAREGILSCVRNSRNNKEFSEYISEESSGCIIIAAGLSGRYSSLPTTLEMEDDDWTCITKFDVEKMKEVHMILKTLRFCCDLCEVGNKDITMRLSCSIHESFLMPVVGPVLNQSSVECQISVTAYLDLFIRSITSAHVMRVLLRFLLTDMYDNKPLLDVLISHINSDNPRLSVVALQLFKTLLELNCEDVLYHLTFRYLIGCYHVVANQKRTIKEVDFYCKSATMFLYLTPQCCIEANKHPVETPTTIATEKVETLKSLVDSPDKPQKLSLSSITSCGTIQSELGTEEAIDFMCYLHDAKQTITSCKKACACWSAVYDGMDVIMDNNSSPAPANAKRNDSRISFMDGISTSFDGGSKSDVTSSGPSPNSNMMTNLTAALEKIDFSLNGSSDEECLGPFLNAIFDKVDSMMDSNVYVNLMLTGLVSRLACYPQPLLRSFLLNSNLVIKPGVRSLVQVVARVSSVADGLVSQLDDSKALISKARQTLRERGSCDLSINPHDNDGNKRNGEQPCNIEQTGTPDYERRDNSGTEMGGGLDRLISLTPVKSVNTSEITHNSSAAAFSTPESAGRLHPGIPKFGGSKGGGRRRRSTMFSRSDVEDLRKNNPPYIRNAIYCVVVLEEFMKELAAISIEQTLV